MNGYKYLPFITFGGFSTTNANSTIATLGSMRSDWGTGFNRPFTNVSFVPSVDWQLDGQSIRAGYELRNQRWKIEVPAYGAGRYNFNGAYTRLNNSAPLNDPAQEWAQFLLGLPTTGTGAVATPGGVSSQFEIAAKADYRQVSHALFVQDDWQVNQNLTVNLGLRMELEQAMTEAHNQAVSGFDTSISSPIEAAALANYAKNPLAQIPVGQFHVRGGLQFTDGGIYNNLHKVMPRAAFSYQLGDKTVIRGGAGLFSYDYYFDAGNQTGFSQPTAIVTTDNNGATFLANLSNPIPSGGLVQPTGASLGAATGLGLAIGSVAPSERKSPYYKRWQIGGQRDLGAGWKMEAFYLDSRGTHLPVQRELNGIPYQYLSTSNIRDTAQESFLSASVPNPFVGMLPGTTLNGATTTRGQLLKPFPEFLSVVTEEYRGSDSYRAASVSVEKRFAHGASLTASYTRSRLRDKLNMLNPSNGILEDRVSPNDRPNRATFSGTLDLPFGAGKKWGSNWRGLTDARARRLGGQRDLSVSERFPAELEQRLLRPGPRPARPSFVYRQTRLPGKSQRCRRSRLPGLGHLGLLHRRRHRPHRRAHSARQQRAHLPVHAAERPLRSSSPDGHRHLQDLCAARSHDVPDQDRIDQRAELHGALQLQHGSPQRPIRAHERGPQQSARHPTRRPTILLSVRFPDTPSIQLHIPRRRRTYRKAAGAILASGGHLAAGVSHRTSSRQRCVSSFAMNCRWRDPRRR